MKDRVRGHMWKCDYKSSLEFMEEETVEQRNGRRVEFLTTILFGSGMGDISATGMPRRVTNMEEASCHLPAEHTRTDSRIAREGVHRIAGLPRLVCMHCGAAVVIVSGWGDGGYVSYGIWVSS